MSLFYIQEGVGDTNDSFAYDGHRVRKWNVSTAKYGEVQFEYFTCLFVEWFSQADTQILLKYFVALLLLYVHWISDGYSVSS